jgi:hypothetical protein
MEAGQELLYAAGCLDRKVPHIMKVCWLPLKIEPRLEYIRAENSARDFL